MTARKVRWRCKRCFKASTAKKEPRWTVTFEGELRHFDDDRLAFCGRVVPVESEGGGDGGKNGK